MFSKRALMIIGLIVFFAVSLTILILPHQPLEADGRAGGVVLGIVAPFQKLSSSSIHFAKEIWRRYFLLVSVSEENKRLKRLLAEAVEENNRLAEVDLSNQRLRELLNFKEELPRKVVAAQVVGRDPSPWFQTVIIDKGKNHGVVRSCPVVVEEGIVGQVIDVSARYAKVLLIIDQDSAVDSLVQRSRARGVIKGDGEVGCIFQYVLRKDDVRVGDIVVSSGLDRVFPKGLRVGQVSEVVRRNAGLFQEVLITSFVDFEKLEEVLVILADAEGVDPEAGQ
jgi:rod shape-determining protein MreC